MTTGVVAACSARSFWAESLVPYSGLLFAPRSGKENREMLADAADKYWNEGKELYETGVTKATELYETGAAKVSEVYETRQGEAVSETIGASSRQDRRCARPAQGAGREGVRHRQDKVAESFPAPRTPWARPPTATQVRCRDCREEGAGARSTPLPRRPRHDDADVAARRCRLSTCECHRRAGP